MVFATQPCEKTIGTSLMWRDIRIRGINPKRGHRRPDGKIIKGWHEHIWKEGYDDSWGVPLRDKSFGEFPEPQEVIDFSLKRWNIIPRGPMAGQLSILFPKYEENK